MKWRDVLDPSRLAMLDLASWGLGFLGTLLLAFAVGVPPGIPTGGFLYEPWGRYDVAFVIKDRWNWGVGLIVLAFILQLPKILLSLRRPR